MSGPASSATPSRRRALLLDFDGTLADTLPGLRAVYAAFLASIDACDKAPGFADVNGANLFDLIRELCAAHAPHLDAGSTWHRYWSEVELAVRNAAPAEGAHQIIAWARQQGWLVGIGSASRTGLIGDWLAQHGLAAAIDCIVGADLCDRGKPDPAIYQLLVARLGVETADCLVVEDSASGVAAAKAAGLEVIRLLPGRAAESAIAAGQEVAPPSEVGSLREAVSLREVASLRAALDYLQKRFEPTRNS